MRNQDEFLKLCVEQLEVGKVVLERPADNISFGLKDAYKQVGRPDAPISDYTEGRWTFIAMADSERNAI